MKRQIAEAEAEGLLQKVEAADGDVLYRLKKQLADSSQQIKGDTRTAPAFAEATADKSPSHLRRD
jgi:hypothetical protein